MTAATMEFPAKIREGAADRPIHGAHRTRNAREHCMKPPALIYCQHSLGLGHFIRSLALADAMASTFAVTFINGGPIPDSIILPDTVRFEHLPPLRLEEDGSLSGSGVAAEILAVRRDRMLALAAHLQPALLVVELYPFGRKKFAVELDPTIRLVRSHGGKIACSVRDVLVTARQDQGRHDERAACTLNRLFDAVLVHADPRLFDLAESFRPATTLSIPVHHTGYVTRAAAPCNAASVDGPTLVCAGGGAVGGALYEAALDAQRLLASTRSWPMIIVAGPLFPDSAFESLSQRAQTIPGLTLHRAVPSMGPLLQQAGRVVSQCGYNSALEIIQARTPALFVPFARGRESEQTMRADKLKSLELADWIPESALTASTLAQRLLKLRPAPVASSIDLDGAATSTKILKELAA